MMQPDDFPDDIPDIPDRPWDDPDDDIFQTHLYILCR